MIFDGRFKVGRNPNLFIYIVGEGLCCLLTITPFVATILMFAVVFSGCFKAQAQDALTIEDAAGAVYSKVIYDWTSAADGTATGRTTAVIPGLFFGVALSPSLTATQPTDLYDIEIIQNFTNAAGTIVEVGTDVVVGALANRSNSTDTFQTFWPADIFNVGGFLSIKITNAGNATEGRVEFYVFRQIVKERGGGGVLPLGPTIAQILQGDTTTGGAKWVTVSADGTIADGGAFTVVDDSHLHTNATGGGATTEAELESDLIDVANVIVSTEIDTEAKFEALVADVTNFYSDNDIVPVADGGTGAGTFTDGGVLFGSGTSAFTNSAVLTNGQMLIGDGVTDPAVGTITADDGLAATVGAGTFELDVDIVTAGSDGDSSTSQSDSGLEFVANKLTLLRDCADNDILVWDETEDDWNCEAQIPAVGVTAAGTLTDNALVRGDVAAKAVQTSGILIDDSDNVSAIVNLGMTGDLTVTGTGQHSLLGTMAVGDNVSQAAGADQFTSDIQVYRGTGNSNGIAVFRSTASNIGGPLVGARSRGTTGSETAVQDGDVVLQLVGAGHDGTDYQNTVADIRFAVDGATGTNDTPGRIDLRTTPDGSRTSTTRVTISSAGDMTVLKDLILNNELLGSPMLLQAGWEADIVLNSGNTSEFVGQAVGIRFTATKGYTMEKAGSIVGLTCNYGVSASTDDTFTVSMNVIHEGSSVFLITLSKADGADQEAIGSQARDIDTFAAGETISIRLTGNALSGAETATYSDIIVTLRIYFDS